MTNFKISPEILFFMFAQAHVNLKLIIYLYFAWGALKLHCSLLPHDILCCKTLS